MDGARSAELPPEPSVRVEVGFPVGVGLFGVVEYVALDSSEAKWRAALRRRLLQPGQPGLARGRSWTSPRPSGRAGRAIWSKLRRWDGVLIALIMVEPIIVIGLAPAFETCPGQGNVVTGLRITVIALGIAVHMILKVPAVGHVLKVAVAPGRTARSAVGAVVGTAPVAPGVQRGTGQSGPALRGSRRLRNRPISCAAGCLEPSWTGPVPAPRPGYRAQPVRSSTVWVQEPCIGAGWRRRR